MASFGGIIGTKLSQGEKLVSKTFRPYDPNQVFLMPASLQDWLPKGHLAYFISDVVDHLDLGAIMGRHEQERGYLPYYPAIGVNP